jgi:hypothetical protein
MILRKLPFVLLSGLLVCSLLYVLFLGNMVSNIVARRSLEVQARNLSSEVGNLELTYLSMSSGIDLAFSYDKGFKETKINFATRKSLGLGSTSAPISNIKNTQNDL